MFLSKLNPYKGLLEYKVVLDPYSNLTRQQMEHLPSLKGTRTLFHDFTEEKCGLIDWALQSLPLGEKQKGVLFCDADICWLGPIPSIPTGKTLALSPHMIRQEDEAKYGMYNAGFFWTNNPNFPSTWAMACKTSRFFEQAALESVWDFTIEQECMEFGQHVNYGWWRLFQSPNGLLLQKSRWSVKPDKDELHSGLCVQRVPLVCIHTHWNTNDPITNRFNQWVLEQLKQVHQSNTRELVTCIYRSMQML